MLDKRSEQYTRELQDPMLSALLRDTLADDPALAASPGRTDRIMRKVLAAGVQPQTRSFNWTPFAWTAGAFASAAAFVVLVFMMGRLPMPGNMARLPDFSTQATGGQPTHVQQPGDLNREKAPTDVPLPPRTRHIAVPSAPQIAEISSTNWNQTPINHTTGGTKSNRVTPRKVDAPTPTEENTVKVASALYDAGTAAKSMGDYESAYQAYRASYDAMPTPDALLASGKALEKFADQEQNTDDSST